MSNGTTLLFGLPGVTVQRVDVDALGARVVHVATAAGTSAPGCPGCGVVSRSVKGNVITRPADLPYGPAPIAVRWHKTRWRCREPACARSSFTESIEQVPAGARTTGRLRAAMGAAVGAAVGDAARSVSEVAAAFGMSWPTAHAAFVEHADALVCEPEPTTALGVDETRQREAALGPRGRWR